MPSPNHQRLEKNSHLFSSIRRALQDDPRSPPGPLDRDLRTEVYYSDDPFWRGTFFIRQWRGGRSHDYFLRDRSLKNEPGGITPKMRVDWSSVRWVDEDEVQWPKGDKRLSRGVEVAEVSLSRWPPKIPEYEAVRLRRNAQNHLRSVGRSDTVKKFIGAVGKKNIYIRRTRDWRLVAVLLPPNAVEIGAVDMETPRRMAMSISRRLVTFFAEAVRLFEPEFFAVYGVPVVVTYPSKGGHPRFPAEVRITLKEVLDPEYEASRAAAFARVCVRVDERVMAMVLKEFPALPDDEDEDA